TPGDRDGGEATGQRRTGSSDARGDRVDPWRLVHQLAGLVGVDPGPYTLRELVWLAEGRQTEQWNHTSAVLAMLANVHRDPKRRSYQPADFLPMAMRPKAATEKAEISVRKDVFVRAS